MPAAVKSTQDDIDRTLEILSAIHSEHLHDTNTGGSGGGARQDAGADELARTVVRTIETKPSDFHPLYPDDMPLWEKTHTMAQEIYRATDITADKSISRPFRRAGKGRLRQAADLRGQDAIQLLDQPGRQGRAVGLHYSDPRGAAFGRRRVRRVVICGDIMTMPGLPKVPAANSIELAPDGRIWAVRFKQRACRGSRGRYHLPARRGSQGALRRETSPMSATRKPGRNFLFVPGPTNVPDRVLRAMVSPWRTTLFRIPQAHRMPFFSH